MRRLHERRVGRGKQARGRERRRAGRRPAATARRELDDRRRRRPADDREDQAVRGEADDTRGSGAADGAARPRLLPLHATPSRTTRRCCTGAATARSASSKSPADPTWSTSSATKRRRFACWSPTTTRCSGTGSARCPRAPRPTSWSWARPRDGMEAIEQAAELAARRRADGRAHAGVSTASRPTRRIRVAQPTVKDPDADRVGGRGRPLRARCAPARPATC